MSRASCIGFPLIVKLTMIRSSGPCENAQVPEMSTQIMRSFFTALLFQSNFRPDSQEIPSTHRTCPAGGQSEPSGPSGPCPEPDILPTKRRQPVFPPQDAHRTAIRRSPMTTTPRTRTGHSGVARKRFLVGEQFVCSDAVGKNIHPMSDGLHSEVL